MKTRFLTGLLLSPLLALAACSGNHFTIDSHTYIVADTVQNPVTTLACTELQYFIHQATGIQVPIIASPNQAGQDSRLICLGESFIPRSGADVLEGTPLGEQEYLIHITPDFIVLAGKDKESVPDYVKDGGRDNNGLSPATDRVQINYRRATGSDDVPATLTLPSVYDAQGTCYAVYDFAERFLGIRFYGPHPQNVCIPQTDKVKLEAQSIRRTPAVKYRYGTPSFGYLMMKDQYMDSNDDMQQLFRRRLRMGGRRWAANHAFGAYQDRFLKKNPQRPEIFEGYHPEYFAKGRGGSAYERQFCYTNPGFIKQVAKDAVDYFQGKGTVGEQIALGDYFALVPMDNATWCLCDECQKQLALDKDNIRGSHFNCGTATHYLWNFVNNVAHEVKKMMPDSDKKIAALAYHVYAYRPKDIQLEDNISVAPCLHTRNYWAPGMERNETQLYKEWIEESKQSGRDIFLWSYLCFPTERGAIGGFNVFPGFNAHKTGEQLRMYAADGVKGIFFCGIGEQLDFYLAMKLLDDPTQDTDVLLNEFFNTYFGKAAEPMQAFYRKIEDVYSTPENYPENVQTEEAQFHQTEEIAWKYLGTPEVMNELRGYIEEATRLATTDEEKTRVQSWVKGVWEYMLQGQEQYNSKNQGNR